MNNNSENHLRKKSWKGTYELFKDTFVEFFRERPFVHSAALSYYTVLTLVPILYLSFETFGKLIGQKMMVQIISNFMSEQVGIKDVSGIIDFLNQVNFEKGNPILQIIVTITLFLSSSALFNSMKYSINQFFNVEKEHSSPKKAILSDLISRFRSILFLAFFGFVIVATYLTQTVFISFGSQLLAESDSFQYILMVTIQHFSSFISNLVIFLFIFKYLHDATVRWKVALTGSLFTSVLLYLGQLAIKYYLTHYFFARNGGIAGSILLILVWMYYSAYIIFLGAKFTTVYGRKTGRSIQF